MENGTISLKNVLEAMRITNEFGEYVRFDISYRTFNSSTKKGGKLKKYHSVKYLPSPLDKTSTERNPRHFENRTRNVELLDGSVRTIRIDFIISFNNCKVIY